MRYTEKIGRFARGMALPVILASASYSGAQEIPGTRMASAVPVPPRDSMMVPITTQPSTYREISGRYDLLLKGINVASSNYVACVSTNNDMKAQIRLRPGNTWEEKLANFTYDMGRDNRLMLDVVRHKAPDQITRKDVARVRRAVVENLKRENSGDVNYGNPKFEMAAEDLIEKRMKYFAYILGSENIDPEIVKRSTDELNKSASGYYNAMKGSLNKGTRFVGNLFLQGQRIDDDFNVQIAGEERVHGKLAEIILDLQRQSLSEMQSRTN